MKRIALFSLFTLLLCIGIAQAQEPPVTITAGALMRHGCQGVAAFQFGANINILRSGADATGEIRGQVFVRPIAFFADDYFFDDSAKAELQAVQAVTMVKIFRGSWSLGVGAGPQQAVRTGGDEFNTVLCAESGWKPLKYFQITAGALYIPIGSRKPDYVYPYLSLGLDVSDLLN